MRDTMVRKNVRLDLVAAGVELARAGGPDAVVLREVTRRVGVVPNAAYRHFADRAALLAAVRDEAMTTLSRRMAAGMDAVRAGPGTPTGARGRMQAVGRAYLDFARTEPGLFDTAFTTAPTADGAPDEPSPLARLQEALDALVTTGLLDPSRRPSIEYPIWASVHGLAVLLRGPLGALPATEQARLEAELLSFIAAAVS